MECKNHSKTYINAWKKTLNLILVNLVELKQFIDELNESLRNNPQPVSRHLSFKETEINDLLCALNEETQSTMLSETEAKVYITISHYFRLLTLTVPNLTVAYEIWLKAILQILLGEVGLSFESWDRICAIGDHRRRLQDRLDKDWTNFLETIKEGKINEEVWYLIQKGKDRSEELIKRRIIRKKRDDK